MSNIWRSHRTYLLIGALSAAAATAAAQTLESVNSTSRSRPGVPQQSVAQQPFANDGNHQIIVANDLGMHCADLDARIANILPLFNVLHAQVIAKGNRPVLMSSANTDVVYSAASNPNDPALANAPVLAPNGNLFKTGFWNTVTRSYGVFYPPGALSTYMPPFTRKGDIGLPVPNVEELFLGSGALELSQQTMPSVTALTLDPVTNAPTALQTRPYRANVPQPFRLFEQSYPVFTGFPFGYVAADVNWFAAEGIPIAAFDDSGRENPFALMRVQARDKASGQVLASLDTVVPMSSETDCKTCHLPAPYGNGLATGQLANAQIPPNDPQYGSVLEWVSEEWAADINALRVHDMMHGTTLFKGYSQTNGAAATPVVCQTCHYTPALDLTQAGPQEVPGGLTQGSHELMSRVMHNGHGKLMVGGEPLFPTMPPPNDPRRTAGQTPDNPVNNFTQGVVEATCYQCHPGKRTQCLRGAMYSGAGAVCQDCHGSMAQVGDDFSRNLPDGSFIVAGDFYHNPSTPRVPWLNEPTCGSCHTGDAASNMAKAPGAIAAADGIRLIQAYLSSDARATPILPTNMRFAEPRVASGTAAGNPQLFRLSVDDHGGVFCEGCHGSTHAEWPTANPDGNDNVAAIQLQGHTGKIMECDTCHTGSLGTTLSGPHGMHPVGNKGYSSSWVSSHGDLAERGGAATCKACHGTRGEGTVLAEAAVDRPNLKCERGSLCPGGERNITLAAGSEVNCGMCHSNPIH